MATYRVSFTITTRGSQCGVRLSFSGVASWKDETSEHDPYTLRVLRNSQGRVLAGPVVGEFKDWDAVQESTSI